MVCQSEWHSGLPPEPHRTSSAGFSAHAADLWRYQRGESQRDDVLAPVAVHGLPPECLCLCRVEIREDVDVSCESGLAICGAGPRTPYRVTNRGLFERGTQGGTGIPG